MASRKRERVAVSSGIGHGATRLLVGRSTELNELERHAAKARDGAARAVLVRGPAGIGRTSLLSSLTERLRSDGMAVRSFTGRETAVRPRPYQAAHELLGAAPTPAPARPAPRARATAPAAASAACLAYAAQRRLYGHAVDLLATGPLALVLDDAQWCDEASLKCVDFVLRRSAGRPLLVLFAQRTECGGPGAPMLGEILAQDRCDLLELGPLGEDETARLVTRALAGPPDERFVRRCAELSGGNPQLLHRLLAGLRKAGVRPDTGGLHQLEVVGQRVVAAGVPAYLAGQPHHVRQVARALAVLGRDDAEPLSALSGVPLKRMTAALDALRRNDVIAPGTTGAMCDAVRSAVLDGLAAPKLEWLRARAARVLNDAGRPAWEVADQLVLLKELTEPWMLAVLRDAAAEAPARTTTSRASVRYLQRALAAELTEGQRKDVRIELARASAQVAPAMALWHLRQALGDATTARDRAPIAVEYGMTALGSRSAPEAIRMLGRTLDALTAELGDDPTPADRELLTSVTSALLVTAVNEKGAMAAVRERTGPRATAPAGDSPAERQLLSALSGFAALDGRPAHEAAALARRSLRVQESAPGGWWVLGSSLVLALADEIDEALAGLDRSLTGSRARHEPWLRLGALAGRSLVRHGAGDVAPAAEDARAAVEFAEQGERAPGAPLAYIALGTVLLSQGRTERAEAALDRAARPGLERHIWEWHHYLYAKGRARRERGDLDGALEAWLRCGRSLEEAGVTNPVLAPWWLPATHTLVGLGRTGEAADLVARTAPWVRRWGTPRAQGLGLLAAGIVAEGRARLDLLAEAVDVLAGSPARLEHAKAAYQLGCELLQHDDARGARRHLRQAIELATRCGYPMLSERARKLLVTAGGRMPQLASSPVDSLTDSERKIAVLAKGGVSNREIAEALFVTPRTVEMHLTNVYRKLDVRGRADLPAQLAAYGPPPRRPGR